MKTLSTEFHTHTSIHFERFHEFAKTILIPPRATLRLLSRIIEPFSGENKNKYWNRLAKKIASFFGVILCTPLAIFTAPIGKTLELVSHLFRPMISYIDNSSNIEVGPKISPSLSREKPLQIRTHNLGFVPNFMSNIGDLRDPEIRAKEVVESINSDLLPPDIIFFQEAFHEDASRILFNGIKEQYPYVVHSIAPQISGFNSGAAIASKYPIENVEYIRLKGMIFPENISPRGVVISTLKTAQGPLKIYSVHTQPLPGKGRADVRLLQLKQIQEKMAADLKKDPNLKQVLVGDLNTSRLTAWGEDNIFPNQQPELPVQKYLNDNFNDLYLNDHDARTGKRNNEKQPKFLLSDNRRIGVDGLAEPSGSWYVGPFNKKGFVMKIKIKIDRMLNHFAKPQKVVSTNKTVWGTPEWRALQPANTARFDYILVPKHHNLTGEVEIRRIVPSKKAESAPTDHLPVDGRIWIP
ncbi:MAG: endonuclease/exonuclease/phosphatase family protein [Parachlamydiaceae bacterium]|nr:endonuclease/exonuclease/phosphatase family protein [Parachlamydiaceae bacterium]